MIKLSPRLNSGDEICSVLRHIQLASKHELKERIIAGIEDINRHRTIHTWSYKLAEVAWYDFEPRKRWSNSFRSWPPCRRPTTTAPGTRICHISATDRDG